MRYHAYDEAPDYLRAEAGAQRRYERQKSRHPLCNDPDHPGCQSCEPEMFPEPVPEGYMTGDDWVEHEIALLRKFQQKHSDDDWTCEAGWSDRFTDFVNEISRGMK